MTGGLLDRLGDPDFMEQVAERRRIVAKLAEQMGVDHETARDHLWHFEAITSSEGQTLH